MFAGEPFSRAAKAGVNFIENQKRAVFIAQLSQQRQEFRRWNVDAAACLDWLDQNRANLFAAEKFLAARFDDFNSSAGVPRVLFALLQQARRLRYFGERHEMSELAQL